MPSSPRSSRAVAIHRLLALNQIVALRYQAFPYQQFGSYRAHVAAISKTLIMPEEAALPIPLKEPGYRVTVALESQIVKAYGQSFPLTAGMLVDADIWLDRRKLYEWILDPLYSVVGRV
jgi:membrane fusion protein